MLLWTDLETTGTTVSKHDVLEIAAIVTDDALNEVARFQRTVRYKNALLITQQLLDGRLSVYIGEQWHIDAFVIDMHDKNGLWLDCTRGPALDVVEAEFAVFIKKHAVRETTAADGKTTIDKPQLAGSTISFYRGFIDAHLPRVSKLLHHCNVDVSTFNETARRFWPELHAARPNNEDKAHRAMAYIEESIRVYKHYVGNLKPGCAPESPVKAPDEDQARLDMMRNAMEASQTFSPQGIQDQFDHRHYHEQFRRRGA